MGKRKTGTVTKWIEKGFGFIDRDDMDDSIFVHVRDTVNRQALIPGSRVSFFYEADEKGAKAKVVIVEEMADTVVQNEGLREMGTVKCWIADRGFGFIARTNGQADAFFHKKSFGGCNEPFVGQAVSFVIGAEPKGATATKVKEEEGGMASDETAREDEGLREMGTVKVYSQQSNSCLTSQACH